MVAKKKSDLAKDLALIEWSYMFMGMASGPSTMAIFNSTPYLIFKDPSHHKKAMQHELGPRDHFIFGLPSQKILRIKQSLPILLQEFEKIYSGLNYKKWYNNLLS